MHALAHTADTASVNTHNDPEVVIRSILQRRKPRLSQLLNVCKGELLRAKRAQSTRATPPVWTLGALRWQDVLEKIVECHHQPSLVSHSLPPDYGDGERWVVTAIVYRSPPAVLD